MALKRFFLAVLASTIGVLVFVSVAIAGWWYYESRPPNLTAEFTGYNTVNREDSIHWVLMFSVSNADAEDHMPGDWDVRLYGRDGDLIPVRLASDSNSDSNVDLTLFAHESVRVTVTTRLTISEALFSSTTDMQLSGSRSDAEAYLANLERFRRVFFSDEVLLINQSLGFRQRVSIKDYYENELARRQRILERQGDPIADAELRAKVEATPFCDVVDSYPCRSGSAIILSVSPPPEGFSREEYEKRRDALPECNEEETYPCRAGEFIIQSRTE